MNIFSYLPVELFCCKILQYLPIKYVHNISLLNKTIKSTIFDHFLLWKIRTENDFYYPHQYIVKVTYLQWKYIKNKQLPLVPSPKWNLESFIKKKYQNEIEKKKWNVVYKNMCNMVKGVVIEYTNIEDCNKIMEIVENTKIILKKYKLEKISVLDTRVCKEMKIYLDKYHSMKGTTEWQVFSGSLFTGNYGGYYSGYWGRKQKSFMYFNCGYVETLRIFQYKF